MNLAELSNWVSQPDVCRLCMSSSGTRDLITTYVTSGSKEVYSEMLQECFGITVSCLNDLDVSRVICELCVRHLQNAANFKQQVIDANRLYMEYFRTKEDDRNSNATYYDSVSEKPSGNRKELLKDKKGKLGKKRKKLAYNFDFDSDTPIAELRRKHEPTSDRMTVDNCKNLDISNNTIGLYPNQKKQDVNKDKTLNISPPSTLQLNTEIKIISERKRVILTCRTVLTETTACPFRHHKSWFRCFFCSEDFMEINLLRCHTNDAHTDVEAELKKIKRYPHSLQIDISDLECRKCQLKLTDVNAMHDHFVEVHAKIIYNECIADYKLNTTPYICHLCKQEFHVFRTLTTHLNEHYANYICDVCGKSFLNSKRLKVHKRTHEDGQYPCQECGKILKTKISKANHIESSHSKRVIKCHLCSKPMKHYNDRIKHMSEAHNVAYKFKCPICSREYNIKHYLATHIRQTHGNKNKKCMECGMAFITNHGLKKHMLKHTGERPHKCDVCGKSYARSYTLKEHLRMHKNERKLSDSE